MSLLVAEPNKAISDRVHDSDTRFRTRLHSAALTHNATLHEDLAHVEKHVVDDLESTGALEATVNRTSIEPRLTRGKPEGEREATDESTDEDSEIHISGILIIESVLILPFRVTK